MTRLGNLVQINIRQAIVVAIVVAIIVVFTPSVFLLDNQKTIFIIVALRLALLGTGLTLAVLQHRLSGRFASHLLQLLLQPLCFYLIFQLLQLMIDIFLVSKLISRLDLLQESDTGL